MNNQSAQTISPRPLDGRCAATCSVWVAVKAATPWLTPSPGTRLEVAGAEATIRETVSQP